jgi:hypothetical protein
MKMLETILYKKKPIKLRTWIIAFITWVLIGLIPAVVTPSDAGFIVDFLVYFLVWGSVTAGIWVVTLFSINRYCTVTITNKIFKVGKQSVGINDINLVGLKKTSTKTPPLFKRFITSSQQTKIPVKFLGAKDKENSLIFGGSWGTPLGFDSFIIEMKDGKHYIVPVPSGERKVIISTLLKTATHAPFK